MGGSFFGIGDGDTRRSCFGMGDRDTRWSFFGIGDSGSRLRNRGLKNTIYYTYKENKMELKDWKFDHGKTKYSSNIFCRISTWDI